MYSDKRGESQHVELVHIKAGTWALESLYVSWVISLVCPDTSIASSRKAKTHTPRQSQSSAPAVIAAATYSASFNSSNRLRSVLQVRTVILSRSSFICCLADLVEPFPSIFGISCTGTAADRIACNALAALAERWAPLAGPAAECLSSMVSARSSDESSGQWASSR